MFISRGAQLSVRFGPQISETFSHKWNMDRLMRQSSVGIACFGLSLSIYSLIQMDADHKKRLFTDALNRRHA